MAIVTITAGRVDLTGSQANDVIEDAWCLQGSLVFPVMREHGWFQTRTKLHKIKQLSNRLRP